MKPVDIVERASLISGLHKQLALNPKETAMVTIDMHRGHLDMDVATMPAKPIHLHSKSCQREIGFVAMAWMVPEAISPESVSTEVRIVMTTASKSTA